MTWQFLYNHNGIDFDLSGDSESIVGTPLISASRISEREAGAAHAISGGYLFRCESEGGATLGPWAALTSDSIARQRHSSALYEGKMYVFGGQTSSSFYSGYRKDLRCYDVILDEWTALSSCPTPYEGLLHTSMVAYQGKLYIYGGLVGSPRPWLWIYDIETDSWSSGADGVRRHGHTAVVYNDLMWVFGGYTDYNGTGPAQNSLDIYDFSNDSWNTGPSESLIGGRIYHSAVVCGNKMLVYGGKQTGILNSLSILDMDELEWSLGASDAIEEGRYQHVAISKGTQMFVQGGLTSADPPFTNKVRVYDFTSDTWLAGGLDSLDEAARCRHAGISDGDNFYTFGGWQSAGAASSALHVAAISFEYSVTSLSVSGVGAADTSNPYLYEGNRTAVFDGTTENLGILPGWSLVLSDSPDDGDEFLITVGCAGTDTAPVRVLSHGAVISGINQTDGTLVSVKNVSGGALTGCVIVATNVARIKNTQSFSRPIYCLWQMGSLNPTADTDLDGSQVSFDNYVSGAPSTVDILVSGSPIDVVDVQTDTLIPGGKGLLCDGETAYRFADGTKYQSVAFILSPALQDTDTATVYISPGGEVVEMALSNDSYTPGPSGLVLGEIDDESSMDFLIRINPHSSADPSLNQLSYSLRVIGLDTTAHAAEAEIHGSCLIGEAFSGLVLCVTSFKPSYPVSGGTGSYRSISEILADNGVTFTDA